MDERLIANRAGASLQAVQQPDDLPGLYIHIPFCIRKCAYCDFYSLTDRSLIPEFLSALRWEAALYRGWAASFDTLYIGGGTPSCLPAEELEGMIAGLRGNFELNATAEVTIEANPGDITPVLLAALRRAGVNRINLGIQSFDDVSLALLGRRHTAREALDAFHQVQEAGFNNIGIDLIYGLPSLPAKGAVSTGTDHPFATWLTTLDRAIDLAPDHLSCYQLTVEPQTPLAVRIAADSLQLPSEEEEACYFHRTSEILTEAGYRHYEISNFAREDRFRSLHNSKYWDHTPYLGLGPAAHSFDGRTRRWNHRSIAHYLEGLAAGTSPVEASETLTDADLCLEAFFLGMRTSQGIHLETFRKRYGLDLQKEKAEILNKLSQEGLVEIRDGFLRPTRAGMAVADSLALI